MHEILSSVVEGTDERLGLPSASGYERLVLCRGSYQLESQACGAGAADEGDATAQSGTRIHAYLAVAHSRAGQALLPKLSEEENLCAEICSRKRGDVLASWKTFNDPDYRREHYYEERLYLHANLEPVFSGQPDEVVICGQRALVIDYKTGWLADDVTKSAQNPQLRALATLAANNYAVSQITVCIIAGRDNKPVEYAIYDSASLDQAEKELFQILAEAHAPEPPLVPGDKQCQYCKGRAICPKTQQELRNFGQMVIGSGEAERRALLDNSTLVELLDRCGVAEKMIGTIRAEAKRRLEAGEAVPGWALSAGTQRRTVTDAAKAWVVLNKQYPSLKPEHFAGCCTVKVGELDKAVSRATGLKAKDVKNMVGVLLTDAGVMETKQSAPSLERTEA